MAMRVAGAFEESMKGKKFKNPETGNDVLFESLPEGAQTELRDKFRKLKQRLEKPDGEASLGKRIKNLGTKAKKFLSGAPQAVKDFINDPESRKETIASAKETLLDSPGKVSRRFVTAAKAEGKNWTRAGEGIANIARGEKVTEAQKQAFKNVAMKVAIGVAGAALSGAAPLAAAGAFCTGLVKAVALKAVAGGLEDLASVSEELGLAGTAISHVVRHLAAKDKKFDAGDVLGKYVELKVLAAIEGLSDDDVVQSLKGFDAGDSS
jgi:hypothetical protein